MILRMILFLLALATLPGYGQSKITPSPDTTPQPSPPPTNAALIKAFRGFRMGMPLDDVKSLLQKDPYFNYRGDPDVYFLPVKEQVLIECDGNSFIRRAYFQFVDKKLFTLILDLNETRVDYFTMMTTLQKTYGSYRTFSPREIVWETEGMRLALEKPLTVKYIDLTVFQRLKETGRAQVTEEAKTLSDFLSEF